MWFHSIDFTTLALLLTGFIAAPAAEIRGVSTASRIMDCLDKLLRSARDGELPHCVGVDKAFISRLPWLHMM
jgi:hypothetical protein